jgi:hypothetical protein
MYGMVNLALEELVIQRAGRGLWQQIKLDADVHIELFARNQGYPDEITYALVGAASKRLNLQPNELLKEFGVHWILHTAEHGYSDLMAAGGNTLKDFLLNLPNLHTRISLLFPHLKPPEFRCSDVTEHTMSLHYVSPRSGLTAFLEGLLLGLGQRFQTPIQVQCIARRDEGAEHDIFHLDWSEVALP